MPMSRAAPPAISATCVECPTRCVPLRSAKIASARHTRSSSEAAIFADLKGTHLVGHSTHVRGAEGGKDVVAMLGEGGAHVRVEVATRATLDLAARGLGATGELCEHHLLGNVHDPCDQVDLVAHEAVWQTAPIRALVDVVQRRDHVWLIPR